MVSSPRQRLSLGPCGRLQLSCCKSWKLFLRYMRRITRSPVPRLLARTLALPVNQVLGHLVCLSRPGRAHRPLGWVPRAVGRLAWLVRSGPPAAACRWACLPDAGDGGDGVGVTEVPADPEPVFEGAEQAVVVVLGAVGAGSGERAEDGADDVTAGAKPVLGREAAGAFILVVDDDDDAVGPERGRGLDLGDFGGEEVVELGVAVVHWLAVRLAVVAAVRDHRVEAGHLAGGQVGVERGHPGLGGAGRDVVGQALRRGSGGGPDPAGAFDVVEQDRRVAGGVEPGQGAGRVAG